MLIRARISLLNNDNIVIFNSKVAIIMHIQDIVKNFVVVEYNAIRHMINRV